jgi:hypothetical protein
MRYAGHAPPGHRHSGKSLVADRRCAAFAEAELASGKAAQRSVDVAKVFRRLREQCGELGTLERDG